MPILNDSSSIQDIQSFLVSSLTHIEPGIRKKVYPKEGYRNLIYVDNSPAAYAEYVARRLSDRRGASKWTGTADNTAPVVDVSYEGVGFPVFMRELGVRWNTIELIQASMNPARGGGFDLKGDRLEAVQDIYEQEKNIICLFGNKEKRLEGFINSPAVSVATATMSIRNLIELISFQNGIQFVINYFLEHVIDIKVKKTNTVITPNAIILPPSDFMYLRGARMPLGGSVMKEIEDACGIKFIEENALQVGMFTPSTDLPFDALTKNRMIVGRIRDKDVSRFVIPMDTQWGRPFPETDVQFKQIARLRVAGTEISQPKGMAYYDLPDYIPALRSGLASQGLAGFTTDGEPLKKDQATPQEFNDLPGRSAFLNEKKPGDENFFKIGDKSDPEDGK
jgi:hypothetical protein